MVVTASEFANLYKFPPSRCVFALRGVEERAVALGAVEVAELAGRGVLIAQQTMEMARRIQAGHSGQYPPETMDMDTVVDRCVGGVFTYLKVQMKMYAKEPRGMSAQLLKQELFPKDAAAITHLPYPEEHEQVNMLLKRARSADLREHVLALPEMESLLERLALRNREYGELLRRTVRLPRRAELRQSRKECQEYVAATASLIIGLYALRGPDKVAEREHLLEPIWKQNKAVGAARRRRRLPPDIDPRTGEELPGDDPDIPGNDPALDLAGDSDSTI